MKEVKLFENETYKGIAIVKNVETFNSEYITVKVQMLIGNEWSDIDVANNVSPKYQKGLFKRLNECYNA